MRDIGTAIKQTVKDFMEDGALQLAAALSFYTLLSLAPLLLLVLRVAGAVWGRDAVSGQLVSQIQTLVGPQGAEVTRTILANAGQEGQGTIATLVGIATLLLGATGAFAQLQSALNQIWEVKTRPDLGVWGFIRTRLLSLAMIAGVGFLLLASLVVSTALSVVGNTMSHLLPGPAPVWQVINLAVSLIVVTLLFAMIFKVLPDVRISWRDVWVGALVTGALFTLGKLLIGLYLGYSSVGSVYGAAGSLVALIVWVYYSSLIVFLGAEFTQVYARRHGTRIQPSEYAVWTGDQRLAGGMQGA